MTHATGLLEQARAAYERRDWPTARDGFAAAADEAPLEPTDLYALANCLWWLGDLGAAIPLQQQAYDDHLRAGLVADAALIAIDCGYTLALRGDTAQGSGWVARAARLAADRPDGPEHGYLAYLDFEAAFDRGDLPAASDAAHRVGQVGERVADATLTALAGLADGRVLVRRGEVRAGLRLLDEAMLAAVHDDLEPSWAGNIYCHLMSACDEISDLRRAGEWTEATARWCESMPGSGPFMGICRVHRARVLQAKGAWDAAEREARHVCRELGGLDVALAAEAHYLLGELELQRGDLDRADAAFAEGHRLGRDPQPGHALLQLARGDVDAASTALRSALRATADDDLATRSRLLPAAVEIALARGDVDTARTHSDELERAATAFGTTGAAVSSLQVDGAVLLAEGDPAAAVTALRDALHAARDLDLRFEVARIRRRLARSYEALGDPSAATREDGAATDALERLGASTSVADAPTATRVPTPRDPSGLTPRETEVLRLVAAGRSNQDIAAELVLSVRTVERHLASTYQKLGLHGRNARAAAVSYALRRDLLA